MNSIDLTPLYRNSIGFDRLASLLNSSLTSDGSHSSYPPYNIEALDENQLSIYLLKEIPEQLKPNNITINKWADILQHETCKKASKQKSRAA